MLDTRGPPRPHQGRRRGVYPQAGDHLQGEAAAGYHMSAA